MADSLGCSWEQTREVGRIPSRSKWGAHSQNKRMKHTPMCSRPLCGFRASIKAFTPFPEKQCDRSQMKAVVEVLVPTVVDETRSSFSRKDVRFSFVPCTDSSSLHIMQLNKATGGLDPARLAI